LFASHPFCSFLVSLL